MPCLHLLLVHGSRLQWGPDRSGTDSAETISTGTDSSRENDLLDSNTLGEELVREDSDHGDLSALGHGVVEQGWRSGVCDYVNQHSDITFVRSRLTLRGSNDDGPALGDVWDSSPGQEEGTVLPS